MTCFLGSCDNPEFARGLCRTDYQALWSRGIIKTSGRPGRVTDTRFRIIDVLETEGGWLTSFEIMARLPSVKGDTVHRALYRMRAEGLIESRHSHPNQFPRNRLEWRV